MASLAADRPPALLSTRVAITPMCVNDVAPPLGQLEVQDELEGVARTACAPCRVLIYTRYHPKASGDHPQAFGITGQSGSRCASSFGKISRNLKKVPHRARTVQQHPLMNQW